MQGVCLSVTIFISIDYSNAHARSSLIECIFGERWLNGIRHHSIQI